MTEEAQSEQTRSSRPSAGQWAIAALIVLALVASLLMVFSGDLSMQATLAVIAALWAAVIGAVLVTKYRRQADTAENRTRDLRLVYELQLEREIAARRQYESDVESSIRHELAAESNHELDELKAQVLALRASLEELLGRPLPESRIAIGLERPRELGAGLTGVSYADVADDHAAAERDFASTAPQAESGRHVPEPEDEQTPVEMTEIIPVVTDDPEADAEPEPEAEADEVDVVEPEPRPAPQQPAPQQQAPQQWRPQQPQPQQPQPQQPQPQQAPPPQAPRRAAPQQRYPQPPPVPQPPQRGRYQPQPGQQRVAFGAGAYEPPSAPFRAPAAQQPPQQQPQRPEVEPESVADDGAHASGRPASELLSRLREGAAGGGPRSGHRRRRD